MIMSIEFVKEKVKPNENNLFYDEIKRLRNELMIELLERDCTKVEYLRGMLSVYSYILESKSHWNLPMKNRIEYF